MLSTIYDLHNQQQSSLHTKLSPTQYHQILKIRPQQIHYHKSTPILNPRSMHLRKTILVLLVRKNIVQQSHLVRYLSRLTQVVLDLYRHVLRVTTLTLVFLSIHATIHLPETPLTDQLRQHVFVIQQQIACITQLLPVVNDPFALFL